MSIWVSWFFAGILSILAYYSVYSKLIYNKVYTIKKWNVIIMILISLVNTIVIESLPSVIRVIFSIISTILFIKIATHDNLAKITIFAILSFVIMAVSEMIYFVIVSFLLTSNVYILNSTFIGIILTNLFIVIIFVIINIIPQVKKILRYIINWYKNKKSLNVALVIILYMITISILLYQNSLGENSSQLRFIVNDIFLICVVSFIILHFNEKSNNVELSYKYDTLLDYAKTYEQEVVEKSKWQHEYENQLIIIRNKISKRNKEARDYINELLENRPVSINSQWLRKLSKFPDIGIKGLLCYKIGQMQSMDVEVFVDVADDLNIKNKHKELLEDNLQDISKILGVYIDNAIQAAQNADKKYIVFEFRSSNDDIIFQISNTYSGKLDIENMVKEKFTTKGKGHGYGLSLVQDILNKNPILSQDREINGMYYVQKLIIDTKNKSL